jgi:hypothetical protein
MREIVNFSCGHSVEVNLPENKKKREDKILELETSGLCPACRQADQEKQDKEHSKKCVCVRMNKEKYENEFSDCSKRLTGYPVEKNYIYVFVPAERVCAEAFRKVIKEYVVNFDEAVKLMEDAFSKLYPEFYQKLKPVAVDGDFEEISAPATPIEEKNTENLKEEPSVIPEVPVIPSPAPAEEIQTGEKEKEVQTENSSVTEEQLSVVSITQINHTLSPVEVGDDFEKEPSPIPLIKNNKPENIPSIPLSETPSEIKEKKEEFFDLIKEGKEQKEKEEKFEKELREKKEEGEKKKENDFLDDFLDSLDEVPSDTEIEIPDKVEEILEKKKKENIAPKITELPKKEEIKEDKITDITKENAKKLVTASGADPDSDIDAFFATL